MYFELFVDKSGFGKFEEAITYALFVGAIVLDVVSIGKLLCSDWILLVLKDSQIIKHVPTWFLTRSRWSGSVSQDNMISYCIPPTLTWFPFRELNSYRRVYGVSETIKMVLQYSSVSEKVPKYLKVFIIDELKNKSKNASNLRDAMQACSQSGNSVLLQCNSSYIKLKWSIGEYQYAESLLLWHLATELCYYQENNSSADQEESETICKLLCKLCFRSCVGQSREYESSADHHNDNNKRSCKILSDYMFYLIVNKPAMLAPVLGNWNSLPGHSRRGQTLFPEAQVIKPFGSLQEYFSS